ncbi:type VI secretion system baseplate subunit TssK [Sansalvadorimonas sp. 2012CJ34-2]|uniref:Type VI secretion system baseplate subunit TssK n=1 Tax=Parendozoicomonas callyspongiae TaxID=2942213 RepID=A0ABT0PL63_9GAMM|nr:type VI secretion system baseplate subunit TssK [Sansalvadorimonas sp. 2012CJ34-2]MCL6272127.1 type VI secretion system baseplate subunit TssK [Sansalvadorimonas sp. 2012CJ34-2]
MDNSRVVWQEGMFLSPQHFQQQDRYLESYSRQLVKLATGQPVGFAELIIDQEQLSIGRFMLRRCSGIFPDGTPFHSDSAIVREVEQAEAGSLVYLALPVMRPGTIDTAQDESAKTAAYRHLSFDQEVSDSTDRENEAVTLTLSKHNLKLLLADEEPDTHIRLPVARIQERQNDGRLLLDSTFIPRCLDYRTSSFLKEQVQNLQARMRSRAASMSAQIGPHAEQKSVQIMQLEYLWLQALNRYAARLDSIMTGECLRPGELYRELVTIAADLATFTTTLAPEFPAYDFDEPYRSFAPVFTALQQNLRQARSEKVRSLPWDDSLFERRRLLRTLVEDRSLFNDARFVLAVTSSLGPSRCRELFPATAKLAGNSRIAERVRGALSAVPLLPMQVPPLELKARPDTVYFEVDTSHALWKELVNHHDAVALHIDEQMPADVKVTLYVVR